MSNAPAILYNNILTAAAYTNEYTGTKASYTSSLTITQDAGSAVVCSGIGIARHTLDGHSVVVEYSSDGISYTTAATFFPTPDRTFFGLFAEQTYRYWRITISGGDFDMAVIKLGQALRSQRNIYGGHTPAVFNKTRLRRPGNLMSGQFLNRQNHASRANAEFSATTLVGSWVRSNIVALQDHVNTGGGVFYQWRPDDWSDDALYGFIDGSIQPVNSGPKDLMTVSFNLEGNV